MIGINVWKTNRATSKSSKNHVNQLTHQFGNLFKVGVRKHKGTDMFMLALLSQALSAHVSPESLPANQRSTGGCSFGESCAFSNASFLRLPLHTTTDTWERSWAALIGPLSVCFVSFCFLPRNMVDGMTWWVLRVPTLLINALSWRKSVFHASYQAQHRIMTFNFCNIFLT